MFVVAEQRQRHLVNYSKHQQCG